MRALASRSAAAYPCTALGPLCLLGFSWNSQVETWAYGCHFLVVQSVHKHPTPTIRTGLCQCHVVAAHVMTDLNSDRPQQSCSRQGGSRSARKPLLSRTRRRSRQPACSALTCQQVMQVQAVPASGPEARQPLTCATPAPGPQPSHIAGQGVHQPGVASHSGRELPHYATASPEDRLGH